MPQKLFAKKAFVKKENMKNLIQLAIDNIMAELEHEPKSHLKHEITRFGRMLEGQGYYHEVDQYYNCIGFEIEVLRQYDFQKDEDPKPEPGFYSVWLGKSHSCAPYNFEESYADFGKAYKFTNGCGDDFEIMKELASTEEVQELIKINGINLNPVKVG